MWFLLIYVQLTAIQAEDRIVLRGEKNPCEGRLEVYHNDQWGLVGHHQWRPVNGEVVCKSLGCGDHVTSGILSQTDTHLSPLAIFWMDEIKCEGTENRLWECPFNGWKISQCHNHNYVSVNCAGNISLSLNLFGMTDECAGVVQFTTPNGIISLCKQNWDDGEANTKANMVCQELNCGKYQKTLKAITFDANGSSYKVPLTCIGNETVSWQCVDWVSAKSNTCQEEISIICSNHERVRLRGGADVCEGTLEKENSTEGKWSNVSCQEGNNMLHKMCAKLKCGEAVSVDCNESQNTWLKCSDRVKIELGESGEKPSACSGDISVSVNGSYHAMCFDATTSKETIGKVVCRELQCGTPLYVSQGSLTQQTKISHVECHGEEKSLWECIHKRGTVGSCQPINIICSGSLDMRLSNGLDRCAGQLEVKSQGSWWSVSSVSWSKENTKMVCQHLECRESEDNNHHRFVKSKLPLLKWKLECNGSDISQCSMTSAKHGQQDSVVSIICKNPELWFLQGNSTCEGRVKSESDGYLQNITHERAAEVCTRNLCGGVLVTKRDNSNMDSSVCPENATSPFNCFKKNTTTPTEPQFSYVKCSGSREVRLENRCYGKVLVCSDENCGVCQDTWTEEQSIMLCNILGCGKVIREKYNGEKKPGVTVASVHCSKAAKNFSQCNFVQLKDTSLCQNPAYVSCTESVNAVLQDPRDKCAGNLKLFYSGAWYPLCTNIDKNTQNAICENLSCGEALSFSESISSTSNTHGLKKLTCHDGGISNCNVSQTEIGQCKVGHLKCKGWRRLLLIDAENACSGELKLQNDTGIYAVSSDGWSKQESNELCKYLECGNVSGIMNKEQVKMPFWGRSYSCTGNHTSIWECEKEEALLKNRHLKQLYISCMDKPQVTLSGNCTGEVRLKNERMCYKSQTMEQLFHELCQQLGCSMFFQTWSTKYKGNARYLSCTGKESNLWQCSSWTDNCEEVLSLTCTKALKLDFSETCGGDLLVDYRGQWEPVCPLENMTDANRICRELDCGNADKKSEGLIGNRSNTDITIKCGNDHKYLKHCIKSGRETCTKTAVIHCDKVLNLKFSETCGGDLLVDYRGQWEPVCPLESMTDANRICREQHCGNAFGKSEGLIESRSNITIKCGNEHKNLIHCIKSGRETCTKTAVIHCDSEYKV
ncbi:scavenger receptor cysteine-rich type 1 protein M160 [Ictalurus furcatus]|uniref:scavenger receptor cysteine-rich type 1 protein M160 n=1 Tax=Ictalurus furcatus TaxID=66913 RepID=UPI00234FE398|nr:scavenger receptor cysteine-rich type 1 protein M160 [Ictalurus furcatus]